MTSSCCRFARLLIGLALLAPAAGAAEAPAADRDPALALTAGHLEWRVPEGAAGAVLTLIGPDDFLLRKVYEAAPVLTFSAADLTGEAFADGTYTWELRFVAATDSGVRRRLDAARAAGDEAEAERLREQLRRPTPIEPLAGAFRVGGGAIEAPAAAASDVRAAVSPARTLDERDQVIPDDLIVQGSTCVGFDCVNNESFGFDTIRLKENNLRIKFEDTSTGTFPSNDWQLTANDSASGGANKFSIEDVTGAKVPFTVEAGATTNSLFVDSTGRVGFRTSTPVLDLHVNTSNTPALRLEQNSSGGFTAQTWDIAGNEANFFVRDVTGGSRLPFRIRPGAPTSSIDIASDGQVGFGDASPEFKIDAVGSNLDDGTISITSGNGNVSDGARFLARRARGSAGAPTAILSGDRIGTIAFQGYTGSGYSGNSATFGASAEENWTTTAQGSRFFINTTPNGTTAPEVRMTVKNDGKVGIGTLTPADKLEVSGGNIRVTGGSFIDDGTTLNVPDYVFEPGYELLPIDHLRAFLDQNGHLPNVPSREEIRANGLNLSQFQMRLLEKVEELTLYTLQQQEQLEALRVQNAELRHRLGALEQP